MNVSENSGTPKTSILIGPSTINHPFWGTPIFGNTQMMVFDSKSQIQNDGFGKFVGKRFQQKVLQN